MEQLNSGQWQSQRNWKEIFATEAAARIERSYLKVHKLYSGTSDKNYPLEPPSRATLAVVELAIVIFIESWEYRISLDINRGDLTL